MGPQQDKDMTGFNARHSIYLSELTTRCVADLSSLQVEIFGRSDSYTTREQADMMLEAVAAGASSFIRSPRHRARRGVSYEKRMAILEFRRGDERDFFSLDITDLLAARVHQWLQRSINGWQIAGEMRPLMTVIQLQALQCATVEIFMDLYPPSSITQTLEIHFREQLPAIFGCKI